MRAVVHDRFGGPEVLRMTELDEPKTHVDSVLVRVRAAGVNPADLAIRAGALAGSVESYFPVVPGWDVAGVVVRAGPGAPEFAPGDEVVGYVRGEVAHRNGGYAELVAADVHALARKPRNADWRQAAALPLSGLTGYQAVGRLGVAAGEVLLVHGAAGGTGSMATQIALARGARVIGTAAPGNHDYLRSLGAEPVRYGDGLVERVRALAPHGVDAVLDVAGRDALVTTPAVGAPGVRTATVVGASYPGTQAVFARLDQADLAAVVALVEAGQLTVRVAASYPLERAADAHRVLAAGSVAGKIVLDIG
jgi:NADPH:quinone reductase-like Zn-dependent oxidoreductase